MKLIKAVDKLIKDIKKAKWKNKEEVLETRKDADCVHNDGFYFFNLNIHRTITLVEYCPPKKEDEKDEGGLGIVNVLWVGSHEDYERIFKNNKKTINKWLRDQGFID